MGTYISKIFKILIYVTIIDHGVNCARILGIFPTIAKSHYRIFESIMIGLAERGHKVDVLTPFPQRKFIPRYNEINVKGTYWMFGLNETIESAQKNMPTIFKVSYIYFKLLGTDICDVIFKTEAFKNLYETNVKYDVMLTEIFPTDCYLILGHKHNIPVIGISSSKILSWGADRFGVIENPAYIPLGYGILSSSMTFYERVLNTLLVAYMKISYNSYQTAVADKIVANHFGEGLPSVYELSKKMSLWFVNSHFSIYGSRPLPPNVIEVGGIHIKNTTELPKPIETFLNNSENGVILFSMGSLLRTESFPVAKQRALIEAFADLPYNVVWRADKSNLTGPFPKNIYFEEWIPQKDILCHPNTKLFIYHGGLLGTQEAIYCSVPMIGIPIVHEQHYNVEICQQKNIAIRLDYDDITKDRILKSINTILENSSYQENMKFVSKIFRDRPISAMDTAIYWIEYVIRHNGAEHLRPPNANFPWYKLYLVDVAFVLICGLLLLFSFNYLILYFIYHKWCSKSKLKGNEKKLKKF